MSLFHFYSWRIFIGYKILVDRYFLSALWKCCYISFWTLVFGEKSSHSNYFSLTFFSQYFHDLFSSVIFSSMNMMCISIAVKISNYFTLFEIFKLLESVNVYILPNFGSFQLLFFQMLYFVLHSFSSPSGILMK